MSVGQGGGDTSDDATTPLDGRVRGYSPREPRRPLLEERREALGMIGRGAGDPLPIRLVLERRVEADRPAPLERALGLGQGVAARARPAGSAIARASSARASAGHDPCDEPEPLGVGAPTAAPRAGPSRRPWPGRPAAAGTRSRRCPGTSPIRPKASTKLAASAASRRSQAKASDAPAPAATPLIAPTIGWSRPRIARDDRVVALAQLDRERGRVGLEPLLEVLAGAERPAGAGQHDRPDRPVAGDRPQGRQQLLLQRRRSAR